MFCGRPDAAGDSASGRSQRRGGDSFDCGPQKVCDIWFITQQIKHYPIPKHLEIFNFDRVSHQVSAKH